MDPQVGGWQNSAPKQTAGRWSPARTIILVLAFLFIGVVALGIFGVNLESPPISDPGEGLAFFGTEIVVHRDTSLSVTESTRAVLRGAQGRHGISRRLPLAPLNIDGDPTSVQYANQIASVVPVGAQSLLPAPLPIASIAEDENTVTFRIGDKDSTLQKGEYDFSFQFTASGFVHNSEKLGASGLIWNLTGGIVHPIASSQIRIKLPDFIDPKTVVTGVFLGIVDSESRAREAKLILGSTTDVRITIERSPDEREVFLTFSPKRPLAPLEQLIVRITWPEGFLENGL